MQKKRVLPLLCALAVIILALTGCGGAEVPATTAPVPEATAAPETAAPEPTPDLFELGISDTDDIVNTTAAERVILVVSFGTSYNESRSLAIGGIESAVQSAYPDYQVRRAFTSQIIIDKLAEREGLKIDNVSQAMNRLLLDGVKEVIVQPTHVMSGYEYDDLIAEITPFAEQLESMKIGTPLLTDEEDFAEVAALLVSETESYRDEGTAIVYMGHGTGHEAGSVYTRLQSVLTENGCNDYIIGTVEHGVELDEVRQLLADMGAKRVILRPLMVVAGDHAANDMAGDEDSWKTALEGDGYEVVTVLEGLGQVEGIQNIYIRHIENAAPLGGAAAPAAGLTAARLNDGSYGIEVETGSSMFRVVDCTLTVENGAMSALVTLSGQGYSKLYAGTGEQALSEDDSAFSEFTDDGERHSFTVPVAALDTELEYAAMSAKKGTWYDQLVVFKSGTLPAEAFAVCEIDVSLSGGSGKTTVASPAGLRYSGGDVATIVWSSPNYSYMIIDGEKYLPTSNEGGSVFELPVLLDTDMEVIACTVAMSEPKEIEYTLHFDSASIRRS